MNEIEMYKIHFSVYYINIPQYYLHGTSVSWIGFCNLFLNIDNGGIKWLTSIFNKIYNADTIAQPNSITTEEPRKS